MVCLARATDQRRDPADRILDDPYAKLFLGPPYRAALAALDAAGPLGDRAVKLAPGLLTFVLARHRFIDDCILASLESHGFYQLVLLGAGYDARAYRFAQELSGVAIFEVDHPATSARKARIVEQHRDSLPRANVRRVEIDFQTQSLEQRILDAGFERGAPTFFVWEGVSMYLTRDAIKSTMTTLRELSGPGSDLAMDFWYLIDTPDLLSTAHRMSPNLLHFFGEPVTFGIHPEDAPPFVDRQGYESVDVADAAELEARYVPDDRRVYPAVFLLHARTRAGSP